MKLATVLAIPVSREITNTNTQFKMDNMNFFSEIWEISFNLSWDLRQQSTSQVSENKRINQKD